MYIDNNDVVLDFSQDSTVRDVISPCRLYARDRIGRRRRDDDMHP